MKSVEIKAVRTNKNIPLPEYQSDGAVGLDLCASVDDDGVIIYEGERKIIPTGIKVQIPQGYEMQIRPRSGLAASYGITVNNSPGTIDADYRGEIGVILINHGRDPFFIKKGDRIAQGVVAPVYHAKLIEVESLDETDRGEGGFGSSGLGVKVVE